MNKNTYMIQGDYAIVLIKDKSYTIDAEDLHKISMYQWHYDKLGYAVCRLKSKNVYLHRLVMNIDDNRQIIDHIDRNPLNNVKSNLRLATKQQNGWNRNVSSNNKSGCNGVRYRKDRDSWIAEIYVNNKRIYLGLHKNIDDAIEARKKAEIKYYGEFRPQ